MAKPVVTYRLQVEQDDVPVRGNALASGDDEEDKKLEDEILRRLDRGDVWAWASVCVIAECEGFIGRDYLGGCCYEDEADFCQDGGYYPQMKEEALADLIRSIESSVEHGKKAAELLSRLREG